MSDLEGCNCVNRYPLNEIGFRQFTHLRLAGEKAELNSYAFVLDDPINKLDPLGLWFDSITAYL
jgi:hypothetical protein